MSSYGYVETLVNAVADGPSLSNSTTPTSIIPTACKITLYPGPEPFFYIGRKLRLKGWGRLSNIVTTPGTLTLDVYLGGSVVAFNGGAMQLSTTVHTTLPFEFEINLICRAIGSGTSANFFGLLKFSSQAISATAVADSTTTHGTLLAPNTTPAAGTGFDSTVAQTLDLRATFSIANAANLIQLHDYSVESMN